MIRSRKAAIVALCVAAPGFTATGATAQQDCSAAPDPVLGLSFESRYAAEDASRSTLVDAREAAAEAALGPLDDFILDLGRRLETVLELAPGDPMRTDAAACLLEAMADWARADALRHLGTETVELTIGSRLAAFAIVAAEAASAAPESPALPVVRDWLAARMEAQMRFWETAPDRASQNNLRAWAALAGASVAALTDDPVIRGWAAWSLAYVVCSANEDGSLPQEMSRGRRALHYQLHALAALVPAAALLETQGLSVIDRCGAALTRAVDFALDDLSTGARTQAITGEVQTLVDGSDPLEDFQLAFLEPWLWMTADSRAEALAAPRRPLSYSKLGGNQTLIWRR